MIGLWFNKLAKLGDAIAISKSESMNQWPTDWLADPLTGVGAIASKNMLFDASM